MGFSQLIGGKANTPAVVDHHGHLHVNAIQRTQIADASWDGDAYRILAEVDLTDTSNTPMFWLRNDRSGKSFGAKPHMVIDRMVVSADANVHVELWMDHDYTSGGGTVTLHPLNRGESASADATAKDGTIALVLDASSAAELQSLFIGAYAPYVENFGGRLLLPKDKALAVYAQGAAANKVRIEMDFFWATKLE